MIPANETTLALGNSLAASIVLKATFTTALALFGAWLARRRRAAVRHALLRAAFGILLVLPIACIVAPPAGIALFAPRPRHLAAPAQPATAARLDLAERAAGTPPASAPLPGLSAWLLTGWIAGVLLFLVPQAAGLWRLCSLRRSALPWPPGEAAAKCLASAAGIHRRVEILLHEAPPGPMTCGVVNPAIVLPPDAQTWAPEDLSRALVHELEHVRRFDHPGQCVARVLCAFYWFHPLVWIAWRRLVLEAERSCDDAVLGRSDAAAYADQLVGLARRLSLAARSPILGMANRRDLPSRVRAILDGDQPRGRAGASFVALTCAVAAVLALGLAPLRMVAARQETRAEASPVSVPKFTATSRLVISKVFVTDRNGKNVEGLTANDFVVTEEGAPQTVAVFEPVPAAGFYFVGYYADYRIADGAFRKIQITGKHDRMAKLDYRTGYYTPRMSSIAATGNGGHDPATAPPAVTMKRRPEYAEAAYRAKYQGTVVLSVEVDENGIPGHIQVKRALGLGLDERATEAVTRWRFRPATREGKPVAMQVEVEVHFQLL